MFELIFIVLLSTGKIYEIEPVIPPFKTETGCIISNYYVWNKHFIDLTLISILAENPEAALLKIDYKCIEQ